MTEEETQKPGSPETRDLTGFEPAFVEKVPKGERKPGRPRIYEKGKYPFVGRHLVNAPKDEFRCKARMRNCRFCGHKYVKEEHDLWECPVCGEDRRCGRKRVIGTTVCVMHGAGARRKGRTTGRPTKDASIRRSYLPQRMLPVYDAAIDDRELLILRRDLALVEARLADLIKRADSGESGHLWKELKTAMLSFRQATRAGEEGTAQAHFSHIEELILQGNQDYDTWGEVSSFIEQRKRLAESERRRLIEMHQMISIERVLALMDHVAVTIEKYITDYGIRQAIGFELKQLMSLPGPQEINELPLTVIENRIPLKVQRHQIIDQNTEGHTIEVSNIE